MKKIKFDEWITSLGFVGFLMAMSILFFVLPKQEMSETEKRVLEKAPVFSWENLSSGKFGEDIESYMAEVVKSGTGTKLKGQSYKAYGKTGTAQVSDSDANKTNAWFVGYASKKGYNDIAIAVIVEHSGTGSKYAIPVAKRVFDLYFNR